MGKLKKFYNENGYYLPINVLENDKINLSAKKLNALHIIIRHLTLSIHGIYRLIC